MSEKTKPKGIHPDTIYTAIRWLTLPAVGIAFLIAGMRRDGAAQNTVDAVRKSYVHAVEAQVTQVPTQTESPTPTPTVAPVPTPEVLGSRTNVDQALFDQLQLIATCGVIGFSDKTVSTILYREVGPYGLSPASDNEMVFVDNATIAPWTAAYGTFREGVDPSKRSYVQYGDTVCIDQSFSD